MLESGNEPCIINGNYHQWAESCWHAFFTAAGVHRVYKGVSGEEMKRCFWFPSRVTHKKGKKFRLKVEKIGMGDGVECLEERCCKSFFPPRCRLLSISASEAFPRCNHSLQVDLFLLKHARVELGGGCWRRQYKKLRWAVIRNITVIVGLSDPTFLPVWVFIRQAIQSKITLATNYRAF